ncbi:glycosyltransferase family 4 protein [Candidatus Formimonas warabiya]|uniref:Glycosyltransferase family 4 protein n=1 Tax=Formimonas warabiya TaxID=1761012 RepID=A0A3G1KZ11_FORW1|nr:glycosyltransferase family 1 protein [Candidatus Formimonas warabiya]ATW27733.1 hypothetical protein DCMF_25920 [Candidatus Formimonas warabiya]
MKVIISALQVSNNNSGIGHYIMNMTDALVKNFDHSYIIYISKGVKGDYWTNEKNVKVCQKDFDKTSFFQRNFFEIFCFGPNVNRFYPDVFFAPDTKLPLGLDKRIKKIVTVHDLAVFKYPETYQKSRVLYWQKYFDSSVKRADRVIAISYATKNDLQEILHVPEEKIQVIYNGVSSIFRPVNDPKICLEVKAKYGLPERFILFVGTFSPRKNLGRLVDAFARLHNEGSLPHKMVIAGEKGWKFKQDLERVKALNLENDIIFPGFISHEDLPVVYSLADVLAYPSLYEGFGLPPLEAMACGTPTIISNTSSLPEVVGKAGVQVNPFSISSITEGLFHLLTDSQLRKRLIQLGFERAKFFSWDKAADELNKTMKL